MNTQTSNILFICSSLEPGKDGVGDYTRKLAVAMMQQGWQAAIIALNDQHLADDVQEEQQTDEGMEVQVLRLSSSFSWRKRIRIAKKFADEHNAGWLSLQYVPFGFHFKGLPFLLGKKLKRLSSGNYWHIMFHELSVNKDESLKFKLWAFLQVDIIRSLMKQLEPRCVSTNTEIYKQRLESMGYKTNMLPLFSNIAGKAPAGNPAFCSIIPGYIQQHREDYIIGTLFGSFDFKSWNMRSLLNKFSYNFTNRRVVIVSLGKMSSGEAWWEHLKYDHPQVLFLSLGQQEPGFISYWLLHYTDFGILTTLPELASKSGSFMAFKEHGVPVVCKERSAALKQYNVPLDGFLTEVMEDNVLELPARRQPLPGLGEVVKIFIEQLENPSQLFGR